MPIYIPPDDRGVVVELIRLTRAQSAKILEALKDAEPRLRLQDLAKSVAPRAGVEFAKLNDYFRALAGIRSSQIWQRLSVREVLDEIFQTLAMGVKPEDRLSPADQERFAEFYENAFAFEYALGPSSKALDVLTESERLFSRSRVLTDFRHIFRDDSTRDPPFAVITHSLRISCTKRGTPFREDLYVQMDGKDLKDLRDTIVRAMEKEETILAKYKKQIKFVVK